jgi:hypothetical protein
MAHQFSTSYGKDSIGVFQYYKKLAERAIAQCPDAGLFTTLDAESNSIAIMVKHMSGNRTAFCNASNQSPDRALLLPCGANCLSCAALRGRQVADLDDPEKEIGRVQPAGCRRREIATMSESCHTPLEPIAGGNTRVTL